MRASRAFSLPLLLLLCAAVLCSCNPRSSSDAASVVAADLRDLSQQLQLADLEATDQRVTAPSFVLVTQYFTERPGKNQHARQAEIDAALLTNLKNPSISEVHLLTESDTIKEQLLPWVPPEHMEKLKTNNIGHRMKFSDAFQYAEKSLQDRIVIVSNADIAYDQTLEKLRVSDFEKKVYAPSRHEFTAEGKRRKDAHDQCLWYVGSHDTWIYKSPLSPKLEFKDKDFKSLVNLVDLELGGRWGVENVLIWELQQHGLKVINPCTEVMAKHLHETPGTHNAKDDGERINKGRNGVALPTNIKGEPFKYRVVDQKV